MPAGKDTYGSKVGRPPKKSKSKPSKIAVIPRSLKKKK